VTSHAKPCPPSVITSSNCYRRTLINHSARLSVSVRCPCRCITWGAGNTLKLALRLNWIGLVDLDPVSPATASADLLPQWHNFDEELAMTLISVLNLPRPLPAQPILAPCHGLPAKCAAHPTRRNHGLGSRDSSNSSISRFSLSSAAWNAASISRFASRN
jgi:hypothetical protein